jgi:hypothetical protein
VYGLVHPNPNIDSLEFVTSLNPSVTGTCKLKILEWAYESLRATLHLEARPIHCVRGLKSSLDWPKGSNRSQPLYT